MIQNICFSRFRRIQQMLILRETQNQGYINCLIFFIFDVAPKSLNSKICNSELGIPDFSKFT